MRILLTGGGTGGHTFPLIAVARKLKQIDSSSELLFAGPDGESSEEFRKEGVRAKKVFAPKFRRYLSVLNFLDVFKLPVGFFQAYWDVFWYMPDVVLSKGGYGSLPVVLVAWLFRIPIIVHESDSVPGAANRFASMFAKKVLVSFEDSIKFFKEEKTAVYGNPVREELFGLTQEHSRAVMSLKSERPAIFVIGGSQGSKQINDLMIFVAPSLADKYEVLHQTGKNNFKEVSNSIAFRLKDNPNKEFYRVYPLLNEEEIKNAYMAASVIVSRAGSGAIFEIAAAGKPSVLIPYKHGASAHQEKNAHEYARSGAAVILEGENLTPHMLLNTLDSVVNNPNRFKKMSRAARSFARPDAAEKIAQEIVKLTL